MNKKELIERIENMPYENGILMDFVKINRGWLLKTIKQLDELQKPVIPQFVADWIANVKRNGFKFRNSSRFYEEIVSSDDAYRVMFYILKESIAGEAIRIWVNANRDTFARAWLDGYEVEKEKEKRYVVKIIGITNYNSYLNYHKGENKWTIESRVEIDAIRTKHTRKELEDAGFGEVFNSPLFEVEEVE